MTRQLARHYKIAVIPGDGIGPEVVSEGLRILEAIERLDANVTFECQMFGWGCDRYLSVGEMMPVDGLEKLSSFDAIYLGAVGDRRVPDNVSLRDLLIKIRQGFDQYANLRPIRLLPGVRSPLSGQHSVDMLFVRENSEGEYIGAGCNLYCGTPEEVAIQESVFTRRGCERIMRYAFEVALRRRRHVTSVSKSNALNYSMTLWDDVFRNVASDYPSVATETLLVDAASAELVRRPERFDVVVASNLFGDILTDLAASLVGGLGLAAGANINPEGSYPSMFEPIHGSAPDIAGKGVANPIAAIWSLAQMLDHLGEAVWSRRVMDAIEQALVEGRTLTPDLGGTCGTRELGGALISYVESDRRAE